MMIARLHVVAALSLIGGLTGNIGAVGTTSPQVPAAGVRHNSGLNQTVVHCSPVRGDKLVSHGGRIWDNSPIASPTLNFVYWGSWWRTHGRSVGFELTSLYKDLGASRWAATVRQYCDAYGPMTWPVNLLTGAKIVVDASNPPHAPTEEQLGAEALKWDPIRHAFGGLRYGIEVIVTPPGSIPAFDAKGICGHHSSTKFVRDGFVYYLPWVDIPYGKIRQHACGWPLREGVAGALSVVAGHEWAEAVTDPFAGRRGLWGTAWATSGRHENEVGDICEPRTGSHFSRTSVFVLKLKSGSFVMQKLWSNAATACVKGT